MNLTKREWTLLGVIIDKELLEIDARLLKLDNGGAYARAHRVRCEYRAILTKLNEERVKEAA